MFDSHLESIKDLHEATGRLTSQDLDRLFDDQLEHSVIEMQRLRIRLDAEWHRLVAELDTRKSFLLHGYGSMAAWLGDKCRLAWGRAKHSVVVARALVHMPFTSEAFATGDVDLVAVRQLVKARSRNQEMFKRDEKTLVENGKDLSPRNFSTAIDYWMGAADAEAAAVDAEERFARRRLHISPLFDMIRVDGELDPESGATVKTAIAAEVDAANRSTDDPRTTAQKRVDALVNICLHYLDTADTPQTGGEKPHISLVVDIERLTTGEGRSEFDDGTVMTSRDALRIVCDSSISRIVTSGPSEVLDVGRRTRTVSPALRRALVIRDEGCTWDGCGMPARFCDAHHIIHWARGGDTNLKNLCLLCRRHHRIAHITSSLLVGGPSP